jgi:nucleotide-binding universal stress UspA family protein
MRTILACIDFSDASERVLTEARKLAKTDPLKTRVHLVHVTQPDLTPMMLSPGAVAPSPVLTDTRAELAKLSTYAEKMIADGLDVSLEILEGPPIEMILAESERVKAERVIMGSHGHGALYELLVGSMTEGVLRRSQIPVLVVPVR